MILNLTRSYSTDTTTGIMKVGSTSFYTIEQPWRNNLAGHSCVPFGTYNLIPYNSPKHGPTWCLDNPSLNIYGQSSVPPNGRSFCEIHSANWAEQLEGCIALGLDNQPMFDPISGKAEASIENSKDAVAQLLSILVPLSKGHILVITGTPS